MSGVANNCGALVLIFEGLFARLKVIALRIILAIFTVCILVEIF